MGYPPDLSDEQASTLIANTKDYQLCHGTTLKLVQTEQDNTVLAQPVGVSLFPTPFPRNLFEEAQALQRAYNKLYVALAEDEGFLFGALEDLIKIDPLTRCLWEIYEEVRREGYVQDVSLGIWRNDYMLDATGPEDELAIKQVEFNTIAMAGATHGNNTSDMHRYLAGTGVYAVPPEERDRSIPIAASSLPLNHAFENIVSGLVGAHNAYGDPQASVAKETCILLITQPRNFNVGDERPIEHTLWAQDPPVHTYRLLFGTDVLEHTTLGPNRELIYHPPSHPGLVLEVSVIYFRAAFEVHEYDDLGRRARLHLERSKAVKCPNLLGHLCTFKKVQQELTRPGVLKRFLGSEELEKVEKTFAPMWPLDESELGMEGRKLATSEETASAYVLKPSLEGGGHNVYGDAIPGYLRGLGNEKWGSYVLMRKIMPPMLTGVIMSPKSIFRGDVVSELGVVGVCLWKRSEGADGDQMKATIVQEFEQGWTFKTKDARVSEMSVVKGYGGFDSSLLVDQSVFWQVARKVQVDQTSLDTR